MVSLRQTRWAACETSSPAVILLRSFSTSKAASVLSILGAPLLEGSRASIVESLVEHGRVEELKLWGPTAMLRLPARRVHWSINGNKCLERTQGVVKSLTPVY